jgi:2-methylisocitrate lyase-like PEP mutase family enzyme
MNQPEKAARLRELHHQKEPLVLINAWDAASAVIVEHMGFSAVATTSAGVANALGYADGQQAPWPEVVQAIRRITHAVQVPVTADIESGFAGDAAQLRRSMDQVVEAGAVGINLEDLQPGSRQGALFPVTEQVERIRLVRQHTDQLKVPLVINARTDAYWQKGASPEAAMENTVKRGLAYLGAGADCIFIPGLRDAEQIRKLVNTWNAPVNILAGPGVPSIPDLRKMGVRRVSFGSGPMRATMGLLRRLGDEAKTQGTYSAMTELAVPYEDLNALFLKKS